MSMPLKEQYIIDADGNKTAIVLPIGQYEQLLEDFHDENFKKFSNIIDR
jgi:hypothetical protein